MLPKGFTIGAQNAQQAFGDLQAANYFGNGALLVDEYDPQIMDDVRRVSILWNRIDKRLAPGETTNGFQQSAIASATARPRRALSFSSSGPTRAARTPQTVKAIAADTTFGIFDRSVYQQQGRRWGNLEQKDVQDLKSACIREWARQAYNGDAEGDDNEFNGLKDLIGSGTTILATTSIIVAICENLVTMTNSSDVVVQPTAIYTNARVTFCANLELLKVGDRLMYAPIKVGESVFDTAQLATPVGFLPLIADVFNGVVAGTPNVYPTFLLSEDKLSWQYVEVLGAPGADPQTYEIALTNALDLQYKTLMFGALDILGVSNSHHKRLNIQERSTIVSIVG
jgi:hypothetical protein